MVTGAQESTRPGSTENPPTTRAWVRAAASGAFAVALVTWIILVGIPNDTLSVFVCLWLGTVAWNIEAPPRRHLQFLRDWWPILVGLVIYFYSRGLADEFNRGAAFQMPIDLDRWLGGGTLPTETLQNALCGNPCDPDSDPRWYDLLLTTVYATHFVTGLTIAAVLWVRNRLEWLRWMYRYVSINFAALAVYILYPMAPPWLASQSGYLPHGTHRITGRGWDDIGLSRVNVILNGVGNPVAAMPSLHAGIAFLVGVYAVQRLRTPYRWVLLAYPLVMGLALVYFAEHYVVDIVAGWLLAAAVLVGCNAWERSRRRPVTPRSASPTD
jgi:membrane-associated phospholipid phosphatase